MLNNYKLPLVGLAVHCGSSAITQDAKPGFCRCITVLYNIFLLFLFYQVKINKNLYLFRNHSKSVSAGSDANLLGSTNYKDGKGVVTFPVS